MSAHHDLHIICSRPTRETRWHIPRSIGNLNLGNRRLEYDRLVRWLGSYRPQRLLTHASFHDSLDVQLSVSPRPLTQLMRGKLFFGYDILQVDVGVLVVVVFFLLFGLQLHLNETLVDLPLHVHVLLLLYSLFQLPPMLNHLFIHRLSCQLYLFDSCLDMPLVSHLLQLSFCLVYFLGLTDLKHSSFKWHKLCLWSLYRLQVSHSPSIHFRFSCCWLICLVAFNLFFNLSYLLIQLFNRVFFRIHYSIINNSSFLIKLWKYSPASRTLHFEFSPVEHALFVIPVLAWSLHVSLYLSFSLNLIAVLWTVSQHSHTNNAILVS